MDDQVALLPSHLPSSPPVPALLPSHLPSLAPPIPPPIITDPKADAATRLNEALSQGGGAILAPDRKPWFVRGSHADHFLTENPGYSRGVVMNAPDGTPGMVK